LKSFLLLYFLFLGCCNLFGQSDLFLSPDNYNLKKYNTIQESISPQKGFVRIKIPDSSFAVYLRNLPLVNDDVLDFKKRVWKKSGDSTVAAVVPVNISGKRLWQCMDILIRFHVDYLEKSGKRDFSYPLPDGTPLSWLDWQNGIRPVFKGLHFSKISKSGFDNSAQSFNRFLNTIFEYSGTQSFWHYYKDIELKKIRAADFIVKKGRKGHAVLIVDLAVNAAGDKVALIGQGDTPACQFYLLKQKNGNPWFPVDPKSAFPDLPIKKQMDWTGLRRFPE
jgi:Domain of unknown function (4846)